MPGSVMRWAVPKKEGGGLATEHSGRAHCVEGECRERNAQCASCVRGRCDARNGVRSTQNGECGGRGEH